MVLSRYIAGFNNLWNGINVNQLTRCLLT